MREEIVPFGVLIWQSAKAKSYQCPVCWCWIRSQYEGDDVPIAICETNGLSGQHRLQWGIVRES